MKLACPIQSNFSKTTVAIGKRLFVFGSIIATFTGCTRHVVDLNLGPMPDLKKKEALTKKITEEIQNKKDNYHTKAYLRYATDRENNILRDSNGEPRYAGTANPSTFEYEAKDEDDKNVIVHKTLYIIFEKPVTIKNINSVKIHGQTSSFHEAQAEEFRLLDWRKHTVYNNKKIKHNSLQNQKKKEICDLFKKASYFLKKKIKGKKAPVLFNKKSKLLQKTL